MLRRTFCVTVVIIALCFTFFSAGIFAEDAVLSAMFDGEGTAESPYMLSEPSDFEMLAVLVNLGNSNYNSAYYKLSNSIDFSGVSDFIPIGKAKVEVVPETNSKGEIKTDKYGNIIYEEIESATFPFMGQLDGDGYTLKNITIDSDLKLVGIFGLGKNAVVKNLRVENIQVNASRDRTIHAGALFGRYSGNNANDDGLISGCHIDGRINVNGDSKICVGGIAGMFDVKHKTVKVDNCRLDVDINAKSGTVSFAGGMFGDVYTGAHVEKCVITGSVRSEVTGDASAYAGAVAARFCFDDWFGDDGYLSALEDNWYTKADRIVSSIKLETIGKYSKYISGTFAHVTGDVSIGNCYFDLQYDVEETLNAHTGIGKTAKELFDKDFLKNQLGFDFDETWTMVLGKPELNSKESRIAYETEGTEIVVQPIDCGDCLVIAAFYDKNRVVKVKTLPYYDEIPIRFKCDEVEYDKIKLFAFDGTYVPLCDFSQIG